LIWQQWLIIHYIFSFYTKAIVKIITKIVPSDCSDFSKFDFVCFFIFVSPLAASEFFNLRYLG